MAGKALSAAPPHPAAGRVGWRWLGAIFLVALAYRGLCFGVFGDHTLLREPVVDAAYHDQWARRIVAGDRLGHGPDDVFKPPGYAYFLAGLYAAFGRHVGAVQAVQMLLGAAACVLLAVLGGRLLGPRAGRTAGILAALYAPRVFFELQLLTPAVSVLLNAAALVLLVRGWDRPGWASLVAAGLLLGVSADVRPDVLLPAALVLGYLLWRGPSPWARRAGQAGCVVAGLAAAVLPVAVRNYRIAGQPILISTNAGINLYVGNAAGDGTEAVPVGLRWERLVSEIPQETLAKPASAGRWWARRALRHMGRHPLAALRGLGRKALAFLNGQEFRNNVCYHFMQKRAWPLRLPFLQYGVILPLAAWGLVCLFLGRRRGEREAAVLCLLWFGGYWAVGVAFFVTGRFRLPAVPLLILPAAWGVLRIGQILRARQWRAAAGLAAVVLAAGAVAWPAWLGGPQRGWVRDYVNLGNALREAGQARAAERAYRQALAVSEGADPDANYLLGRALLMRNDVAAGLERLAAARRALPGSPDILLTLAQAHAAAGRTQQAKDNVRELLALAGKCNLWPRRGTWAAAYVLLGRLEPASAADHWRQAWRIDPRTAAEACFLQRRDLLRVLETFEAEARKRPWDWYSQANYGLILLTVSRPAEAEAPLRQAAGLAPERKRVRLQLARAVAGAGRTDEAVEMLGDLDEALPDGPLRREVRSLLRRLSGAPGLGRP